MTRKKDGRNSSKPVRAKINQAGGTFVTSAFIIVFVIWLVFFIPDYASRIITVVETVASVKGLNDAQKKEKIYGEFYEFMQYCSSRIPENATAFMSTNRLSDYYYGSYYLYPRRILIGPADKPVDSLNLQNASVDLTKEFCRKNNISYIIVPQEFKVMKVN
jgi:hypothetical protein